MIANIDNAVGKMLEITSAEALEATVADVVRLKINHTRAVAEMEAEMAAVQKRHQARIASILERIQSSEASVAEFCRSHRSALFSEKKSRETVLASFGFELTPPRVEPANRKIKWKDVVDRLQRLAWGKAYLKTPAPTPDKNALLADREKLTPEQLTAAGIEFCQDEQFFIRPKPESAQETVTEGRS